MGVGGCLGLIPQHAMAKAPDSDVPESPYYVEDPEPGVSPAARMRDRVQRLDAAMATTEARAEELLAFHTDKRVWRVYRTLCRIRFGYLSFLVLMIILLFSFTLLMEIFFTVFLPSARTWTTEYVVRSVILLVLLPVLLFVLSYFYEESWRFLKDAIDKTDGGLPNFRLALAIVIYYVRHRSAFKAAERDSNGNGDAPDDAASSSSSRSARQSFFVLPAGEDPYVDKDADTIKEEREDQQDVIDEALENDAATAKSPARRRWKRIGAAVVAANALKRTQYDGPAIRLSTFLIVDFVCPVLFELVTVLRFLIEILDSGSPYAASLAYVRTGFWFVFGYLVLWMGCHFWSSRNPQMRRLVSHYRRNRRHLKREMSSAARERQAQSLTLLDVGFRFYHHLGLYVNPLAWIRSRRPSEEPPAASDASTPTQVTIDVEDASVPERPSAAATRRQNVRDAQARMREKNPWFRLSYTQQAWILLVGCVAAALVSFWSFFVGWPIMGILLIMLANVIQRRFPQIFGDTFRHFITGFVVFSLIFFSSTWIIGTFVSGGGFTIGAPTADTLEAALTPSSNLAMPKSLTIEYPVCTIDYEGLTILDLAIMADAAYSSTPEQQLSALQNRFNGTELQNFTMVAHSSDDEHQVWFEAYFPSLNMTVLSIRGTASAADALEDMHFWFGIVLMQGVNMFIPFLNGLPHDFIVSLLSMKSIAWFMPEPVFEPVVDHAQGIKERVGDRFVVTGHSLGGAMAAVVGARVKTQAISLSGPGLLYTRERFDVEAQDVRDYVLTLKPRNDIVPQVDKLGGMVQELRCREKSPLNCHSTYTHLCELYLSCGDARQRNWAVNDECLRYQELPIDSSTD